MWKIRKEIWVILSNLCQGLEGGGVSGEGLGRNGGNRERMAVDRIRKEGKRKIIYNGIIKSTPPPPPPHIYIYNYIHTDVFILSPFHVFNPCHYVHTILPYHIPCLQYVHVTMSIPFLICAVLPYTSRGGGTWQSCAPLVTAMFLYLWMCMAIQHILEMV